jgi:hypothetical protein
VLVRGKEGRAGTEKPQHGLRKVSAAGGTYCSISESSPPNTCRYSEVSLNGARSKLKPPPGEFDGLSMNPRSMCKMCPSPSIRILLWQRIA